MKVAPRRLVVPACFAVFLALVTLPSSSAAQSSSDNPSGYGRTMTVAQASTTDLGGSLSPDLWLGASLVRRVAASRDWGASGGTGQGFGAAWIRSFVRSGERGSKWRSPSLASARTGGR